MSKLWLALCLLGLFLVSLLALSCGTSSQGPTGQLQSITLMPAMADAQDYPDGNVPFVATGIYADPPITIAPLTASWGVCQKGLPTVFASVSTTGVASCASGAAGAYQVFAFKPTNCTAINACGGGCTVVGTAQLTCP
jgi:hypothetical protein